MNGQRKRQGALLIAGLILLVAGCARPPVDPPPSPPNTPAESVATEPAGQTPAEPQPSAGRDPEPAAPMSGCERDTGGPAPRGSVYGYMVNPPVVRTGICALSAPTGQFSVFFFLPDGVTEQVARAALKAEGALTGEPKVVFAQEYATSVTVDLPAGRVGDQVSVRLEGPVGPGGESVQLGFTFTRREAPSVTAEYLDPQGHWRPVPNGQSLPVTSVKLRFRGTNIAPGQLSAAYSGVKGARVDYSRTADALEAVVTGAPSRLHFDFSDVANGYGLKVIGHATTLYLGAPPMLVALDPASGQEDSLGEVPPDIFSDSLSPDGNWLLVKSLKPDHPYAEQVTLVRLDPFHTEVLPVTVESYPAGIKAVWAGGKLILPAYMKLWEYDLAASRLTERPSQIARWGTASPDGRLLMGYSTRALEPEADRLASATIWVRDLLTGQERNYGELVHAHRPYEWYPYVIHEWRDGVLALNDEAAKPGHRNTILLNLATGQSTIGDRPLPFSDGQPDPWAPGPGGWSYRKSYWWEWGGVSLRAPDGAVRTAGSGKILGWLPDGRLLLVRWTNEPNRRDLPGH